jgi:hypothetical protein
MTGLSHRGCTTGRHIMKAALGFHQGAFEAVRTPLIRDLVGIGLVKEKKRTAWLAC